MRKILNYGKHIFLENKKVALAAIAFVVLTPTAFTLYNHFALTPFESAQNKAILEEMESSQITVDSSSVLIAEVDALIAKPDYKKAQAQAMQLLEEENLNDNARRTVYAQLAVICQNTKDFSCIDKVIEQYGGLVQFDYFYLNDAAELALAGENSKAAKSYYKKLLTEIDNQGGEEFVNTLNDGAMKQLSYETIKSGASDE